MGTQTNSDPLSDEFEQWIETYCQRAEYCLERALPAADLVPAQLHEAMRYATLSGGKRIRPLLVYATGECLGVPAEKLDLPATAIELIHTFSLVHDDLPAMDDDDLRRGRPTVHRQYDEATAILAADALQPLAFAVLARSGALSGDETKALVDLIAGACGSPGMTGGQAIDLASEGTTLSTAELTTMHRKKTGALIWASVMSACLLAHDITDDQKRSLDQFSRDVGLAFQIRDDILDVAGDTDTIGKPVGSDQRRGKATWPALFGLQTSQQQCDELLTSALADLNGFGDAANSLRQLASYLVERAR